MKRVRIIYGHWSGTIGLLIGAIPNSEWFNVQIEFDGIPCRLALKLSEFIILD